MPKYKFTLGRPSYENLIIVAEFNPPIPARPEMVTNLPVFASALEAAALGPAVAIVGDYGTRSDAWKTNVDGSGRVEVCSVPQLVDDDTPLGPVVTPVELAPRPSPYIAAIDHYEGDDAIIAMTSMLTGQSCSTRSPREVFDKLRIGPGTQFLYTFHGEAQEPPVKEPTDMPVEEHYYPGQFPRLFIPDVV